VNSERETALRAMKYYVYISDSKLDMLYPQIPLGLRDRIAAELRIDLKVAAISLSEKPSQETRLSRLRLVTDYLERESTIGSLGESGAFVRDVLPMRWGPLQIPGEPDGGAPIFFSAVTESHVVGLGGSLRHVIGATGSAESNSHSALYELLSAIEAIEARQFSPEREQPADADHDDETAQAVLSTFIVAVQSTGPLQLLEFLAKPLLRGEIEGKSVTLATPLYVALAE
jgi:uncharacterized protein DUF7019